MKKDEENLRSESCDIERTSC